MLPRNLGLVLDLGVAIRIEIGGRGEILEEVEVEIVGIKEKWTGCGTLETGSSPRQKVPRDKVEGRAGNQLV